jgi:hypothetical protein
MGTAAFHYVEGERQTLCYAALPCTRATRKRPLSAHRTFVCGATSFSSNLTPLSVSHPSFPQCRELFWRLVRRG